MFIQKEQILGVLVTMNYSDYKIYLIIDPEKH